VSTWADQSSLWGSPSVTWAGRPAPRRFTRAELRGQRSGGSTLAFPLRMDAGGRVVTVSQLTPRHAAEIVGHVLSCQPGERGLAPGYGLKDPSGQQVVSGDLVASTITACEPDVRVDDVYVDQAANGQVRVTVSAAWAPTVMEA